MEKAWYLRLLFVHLLSFVVSWILYGALRANRMGAPTGRGWTLVFWIGFIAGWVLMWFVPFKINVALRICNPCRRVDKPSQISQREWFRGRWLADQHRICNFISKGSLRNSFLLSVVQGGSSSTQNVPMRFLARFLRRGEWFGSEIEQNSI